MNETITLNLLYFLARCAREREKAEAGWLDPALAPCSLARECIPLSLHARIEQSKVGCRGGGAVVCVRDFRQ